MKVLATSSATPSSYANIVLCSTVLTLSDYISPSVAVARWKLASKNYFTVRRVICHSFHWPRTTIPTHRTPTQLYVPLCTTPPPQEIRLKWERTQSKGTTTQQFHQATPPLFPAAARFIHHPTAFIMECAQHPPYLALTVLCNVILKG